MLVLADNSPCNDCQRDIGVRQPNGTEQGEYFYCEAFKKIPGKIAEGKNKCKKQIKE